MARATTGSKNGESGTAKVDVAELTGKMKGGLVPDSSGSLQVSGLEDVVEEFRVKKVFSKDLEKVLGGMVEAFRGLAKQRITAAGQAGAGVERVEFVTKNGLVMVSLPDTKKAGNRLGLGDEQLRAAEYAGLDLEGMGLLEKEETVVLGDLWVEWFRGYLTQMQASGTVVPPGYEIKTVKRLRGEAVGVLRAMAAGLAEGDPRRDAAAQLVDSGVKAATVAAK